jgi:hypothetical protein
MGRCSIALAAAFFAGLTAAACARPFEQPPDLCDPRAADPCPSETDDDYVCCSDDPSALDLAALDAPALPAFEGRGGAGTPLFAGARNGASRWGQCVRPGSVAPAFALADAGAEGCPVPCNPSWDPTDVEAVCGAGTFCCQTVEIELDDCVWDPTLGDAGCHRPARGEDGVGGHATLQDPDTLGCAAFVDGLADEQLAGSDPAEVFDACVRRLTAADQRGFCLGGPAVDGCPLAQPSVRDACEMLNDNQGLSGCG